MSWMGEFKTEYIETVARAAQSLPTSAFCAFVSDVFTAADLLGVDKFDELVERIRRTHAALEGQHDET
jgi:hypothetical protein